MQYRFRLGKKAYSLDLIEAIPPDEIAELKELGIHIKVIKNKSHNMETNGYKFEVKPSSDKKFYFNFVAPNGQIMFTSETYTAKSSVLDTIESIKKNVANAETVFV